MAQNPYERFDRNEWIARDELALDRTRLANERTLLAYLRSAAALLLTGASIINFADTAWFMAVGAACLPGSVVVAILGMVRFNRMKARFARLRGHLDETENSGQAPKE